MDAEVVAVLCAYINGNFNNGDEVLISLLGNFNAAIPLTDEVRNVIYFKFSRFIIDSSDVNICSGAMLSTVMNFSS